MFFNTEGTSKMSSVEERLEALEAEVKKLRKKLKAPPTLSSYTEALRAAEPEEAEEWIRACQELINAHPDALPEEAAAAVSSSGGAAGGKKKRAATNKEGPAEWNAFKKTVWRELAAACGILCAGESEEDLAAFKKACAAYKKAHPEAKISYQDSLTEAARRKAEMEGKDPEALAAERAAKNEARKAKKSGSVAGSSASSAASAASAKSKSAAAGGAAAAPAKKAKDAAEEKPKKVPKAKSKAAAAEPSPLELLAASLAEAGLELKTVGEGEEERQVVFDPDSKECYAITEELEMGERLGIWDEELNWIDESA